MWNRLAGLVVGCLLLLSIGTVAAATTPGATSTMVCPSRLQLRHPERCSSGGARSALIELAVEGLYMQRPLPTVRVDPSLGSVPFNYLRSGRGDGTVFYTSLDDALNQSDPYRTIEPGFVFFSWIDRFDRDGQIVYMIDPGVYVRGDGLGRISLPHFQGLAFSRTPDRPFAWVLTGTETSIAPGFGQPTTGHWLDRYETVWVYDMEQVGDYDWYRIGPNEWIEQRLVAVVNPDPVPPKGIEDDRWISVDLYEQTLMVYEDGQLVYATLVSSGLKGWWTQPGVFQVFSKLESDRMAGAFEADRSDFYYLEDVPWILYFDESRALHGAYWHNGFGYPRSHGCVNLSLVDSNWIYNWAEEGTWVYVFDPSGETPTDPMKYGPGGF